MHGALLATPIVVPSGEPPGRESGGWEIAVRTSVLRLKSKPASKLDGFVSATNSGSNVVESVANRDWMLLGGSLKLSLAM